MSTWSARRGLCCAPSRGYRKAGDDPCRDRRLADADTELAGPAGVTLYRAQFRHRCAGLRRRAMGDGRQRQQSDVALGRRCQLLPMATTTSSWCAGSCGSGDAKLAMHRPAKPCVDYSAVQLYATVHAGVHRKRRRTEHPCSVHACRLCLVRGQRRLLDRGRSAVCRCFDDVAPYHGCRKRRAHGPSWHDQSGRSDH